MFRDFLINCAASVLRRAPLVVTQVGRSALAILGCISVACSTRSEVGRFDPEADAAVTDSGTIEDAAVNLEPALARLSLGGASTCGLTSQGEVQCWGDNTFGQLGVGDVNLSGSIQPLAVVGLTSGVRAVFGGPVSHCAVFLNGRATCWGDSVFGSFSGQPGTTHFPTPAPFEAPGLTFVASMALGIYFHCALAVNGSTKCYGLNNAGQLGNGSLADSPTPADVLALEPSQHVSAAGFFACAVIVASGVKCWGFNQHGQLGNGAQTDALTPVEVLGLPAGVTAVANGRDHVCALVGGDVWCWGGNAEGQLGTGPGADRTLPAQVPGVSSIVEIASGALHSCARSSTGAVHCWGAADSGSSPSGPLQLASAGAVEIAAGGRHSCALFDGGSLRCWGSNDSGQLGAFGGQGAPF